MPAVSDLARRGEQLTVWCRDWLDPRAEAHGLRRLEGHGGETIAFAVRLGTEPGGRYVVRLAPPGVRRQGNTDVLRQVPLLRALETSAVPVARVVAATGDERWLGTDAVVQEFVDGGPLHMFERGLSVAPDAPTDPYVRRAVAALARIHETEVPDWEEATGVTDELARWARLIGRMPEPAWVADAERLAERLLETDPGGHRVGLFHGDYQTNNVLYDERSGELRAVVDWELAGTGPTGLDVGWFAMMLDPRCWGAPLRDRLLVTADPADVLAWYEAERGHAVDAFPWYVALACYRYGVISSYNVRLHRTGRRVDPFNEAMAGTVPALLAHGLAALA